MHCKCTQTEPCQISCQLSSSFCQLHPESWYSWLVCFTLIHLVQCPSTRLPSRTLYCPTFCVVFPLSFFSSRRTKLASSSSSSIADSLPVFHSSLKLTCSTAPFHHILLVCLGLFWDLSWISYFNCFLLTICGRLKLATCQFLSICYAFYIIS